MRCKKVKILISAALDGELSRSEELALERHLSSCAACASEKAEVASLREKMHIWADEEPSTWLAESFTYKLSDLREHSEIAARRPGWVYGAAGAGLVAAVLALVFILHGQFRTPTPEKPYRAPAPIVAHAPKPTVNPQPPLVAENPAPAPTVNAPKRTHVGSGIRVATASHRVATHTGPGIAYPSATAAPDTKSVIFTHTAISGSPKGQPTTAVADNLGEAGLAMNATFERMRGTLQKAADLVVSEYPKPAENGANPNGGDL